MNILLSSRSWHNHLSQRLEEHTGQSWILLTTKEEFTAERLKALQPRKIYIPHWSYIIPDEIWQNYECVVFHMTDLPYGRGGSPLQNLILRGVEQTQISALRVVQELDAGPIYIKKPLCLAGATAEEIFSRASKLIFRMIVEIEERKLEPQRQVGEPVLFKRRKPHESDLSKVATSEQLFDYIRMLDAEGYPHAYLETDNFVLRFRRAARRGEHVIADVEFIPKQKDTNGSSPS